MATVELGSLFCLLQIVFELGGYEGVAKEAASALQHLPVRIMLPAAN